MEIPNAGEEYLPEGISIASSVYELDRYPNLKATIQQAIGIELTDKIINDVSLKDKYKVEYSLDPDGDRVYITEEWQEAGYEFIRHGSTRLKDDDQSYILISSVNQNTKTKDERNTIMINLETKDGILKTCSIQGQQDSHFKDDNIPYINHVLKTEWLSEMSNMVNKKFDKRGDFKYVQFEADISEDKPKLFFGSMTKERIFANTLVVERLNYKDKHYWWGSLTTKLPFEFIPFVDMKPLGPKKIPSIDMKI